MAFSYYWYVGLGAGGLCPDVVVIPNFVFTYERANQLAITIVNKEELREVAGDVVCVRISSGDEAVDVLSFQRRVRIVMYSDGREIDKSSILTLRPGQQERVELAMNGVDEAVTVVMDEDTKDQLDKAVASKLQMRDLGGLL